MGKGAVAFIDFTVILSSGRRRWLVRRAASGLQGWPGLFFPGRPPGAGSADTLRGSAVEAGVEFFPPAADGIDVQAANKGEGGIAAIAEFLGLEGGQPAVLLLIETAHQEVEVGMPVAIRVAWGVNRGSFGPSRLRVTECSLTFSQRVSLDHLVFE